MPEGALSTEAHSAHDDQGVGDSVHPLAGCLIMASYGVALLLPGASAVLRLPRHRDARDLVLVHDAHHYGDLAPTISAEQYQTWRRRSQKIFDGFAFYRVMHESVPSVAYAKSTLSIASASANLFELLGLPVRFTPIDGEVPSDMPRLILSDEMWKKGFGGDPYISGRKVRVGTRIAVVGGVAPGGGRGSCREKWMRGCWNPIPRAFQAAWICCGASDVHGGTCPMGRELVHDRLRSRMDPQMIFFVCL